MKPDIKHPGTGFFWWFLVTVAVFAGLTLALGAPYIFGQGLQEGAVAEHALVATRRLTVVDQSRTRQAEEEARQSVLPVFRKDHSRDPIIKRRLSENLALIAEIQTKVGLPMPESLGLTPEEQVYLLQAPEDSWRKLVGQLGLNSARRASGNRSPPAVPDLEFGIADKLLSSLDGSQTYSGPDQRTKLEPIAIIERVRSAYRQSGSGLNKDMLFLSVAVERQDWPATSNGIEAAASKLLKLGPFFPGVARSEWEQTVLEFLPENWDEKVRLSCARLIAADLEPTVRVDLEATKAAAEAARASVQPVKREVRAGEVIVSSGEKITGEKLRTLNELGITHSNSWPMLGSLCVSLLAAFALVGIFLYSYEPKHLYSLSSIGLMGTVSIVTCSIAALIGRDYPMFVPLPAAVLVLTIFLSQRIAIGILALLMIFLSVNDLISTQNLIALGMASAVSVGTNIRQRKDLMSRGFLIGMTQAAGYLLAVVVTQSAGSPGEIGRDALLQIFGGLSSCIVAIGSLPFLENIFGMVTMFRLSELTDPTQPLLRQLEESAPGTYQHSLAVANLAEAGARAIGADVNLVRAGSLYHDIGKMVRPRYFIENQLGDKNPHDGLSPEESRDRVLAHVTDGLALAQRHGVPKAVLDFIPQHQGTTLMAYFYHKACLRDGAENTDQMFYRYPGPKPQSKEAAIVMLADVSEAVTHSLKDPSQEEVEAAMATVFKARWDDGQFAETGLSADELERVKKAFVRVWRTLHHERLKYPSTTTGRMAVPPEPPSRVGPAAKD